jgi:hypothetical protein
MSNIPIPRPARIYWDVAVIALSRGMVALVDILDADLADERRWSAMPVRSNANRTSADRDYYAHRAVAGRAVYLHKVIAARAGLDTSGLIDHVDADTLNCRRKNLREANRSGNAHNARLRCDSSTGIKGVSWVRHKGKWQAHIGSGGRQIHLGFFATPEEAGAAYAAAAMRLHGEFARVA